MRIDRIPNSFALVATLAAAAWLSGCLTPGALRSQRLETATSAFENAMRWSDFAGAASHLEAKAPAPDFAAYRGVKVVAYDPKQATISKDITEARILVEIRYVHTERMRERQILSSLHWRYDDKESRWRLASGLPTLP
jgi:hypothetical protein